MEGRKESRLNTQFCGGNVAVMWWTLNVITDMEKDLVRFRIRERESGLKAIFLSYYYKGKRREESLRLYLIPERTSADRKKNKETWAVAEIIKARRQAEFTDHVFGLEKDRPTPYLLQLAGEIAEEKNTESSRLLWASVQKRISEFLRGNDILISEVDVDFVERFVRYLQRSAVCAVNHVGQPLSNNTQWVYYSKFKAIFNHALRLQLIHSNPCDGVRGIRKVETERAYLTIEELHSLIDAPCANDAVRTCYLFSCLTGLRCSDIINLTWGQVRETDGFTRIVFRQQKTGGMQYLDINSQAAGLMGERGRDTDFVFPRMPEQQVINLHIRNWADAAGIKKHLSFHTARHTFATMMLTLGADLYTVSKLLGHSNISTTQVYAKVLDKSKQDAVSRIPALDI